MADLSVCHVVVSYLTSLLYFCAPVLNLRPQQLLLRHFQWDVWLYRSVFKPAHENTWWYPCSSSCFPGFSPVLDSNTESQACNISLTGKVLKSTFYACIISELWGGSNLDNQADAAYMVHIVGVALLFCTCFIADSVTDSVTSVSQPRPTPSLFGLDIHFHIFQIFKYRLSCSSGSLVPVLPEIHQFAN